MEKVGQIILYENFANPTNAIRLAEICKIKGRYALTDVYVPNLPTFNTQAIVNTIEAISIQIATKNKHAFAAYAQLFRNEIQIQLY